ncbi:MAG: c-type cytochrome [Gemmatimonadales bacterium]|nr:c-type cytochrome [Gemmatimonadales bacterium]
MWRTNLTIVGLVIGVLALYTLVANSIPQIQSEVPQAVDLSGDVSPRQLAAVGERIFNGAGGCTACHGLGTRAPNLLTDEMGAGPIGARCGNRRPGMSCKDYLYESLTEPAVHVVEGYQPIMQDMRRTMPADQIWAVVAFLESQGGTIDVTAEDVQSAQSAPPAGAPAAATASLEPREILAGNACLGCHKLGSEGGAVGPPFDGMGGRLQPDQIRQAILNPGASMTRGYEAMAGVMPATFGQQLTAAQLEAVVSFLSSQR